MDTKIRSAIDTGLNRIPTLDITDKGLGPWSVSTLKTLEKCPLKFFLDKVAKAKPEVVITEDSIVTQVGRAAHYWVELIVQGKPVKEALEIAKQEHIEEVTELYWHKVESLINTMYSFEERMEKFRTTNKILAIQPELKIGLDYDLNKIGFFDRNVYFRGVIDLPILMESGDVVIIDHKYGPDPAWGTRHYQKQFNSYKVLYHQGVTPIRGAQTGIHFMKHNDMVMDSYTPASRIPALGESLKMDIKDAVAKVADDGTFNYNRTTMCNYCDFREMCKNGKRGTAGELQFIVDESKPLIKQALEKSK